MWNLTQNVELLNVTQTGTVRKLWNGAQTVERCTDCGTVHRLLNGSQTVERCTDWNGSHCHFTKCFYTFVNSCKPLFEFLCTYFRCRRFVAFYSVQVAVMFS